MEPELHTVYKNCSNTDNLSKDPYLNRSIVVPFFVLFVSLITLSVFVNSFSYLMALGTILTPFILAPFVFYYRGRYQTKKNMMWQGYNIEFTPTRSQLFGGETYKCIRTDPNKTQSQLGGYNNNPFATSRKELQNLETRQRKNAVCKICTQSLFETEKASGAYFVEKRKRLWMFGLVVSEEILSWEAFCPKHKPTLYCETAN